MSDLLSRTEYRISVLEELIREFTGEVRALRSEFVRERRRSPEFERKPEEQCLGCLHYPHVANACRERDRRGERCICDVEQTRDPGSIIRTRGRRKGAR